MRSLPICLLVAGLCPGLMACAQGDPGTGPGRGDGSTLRGDGAVTSDASTRSDGMTVRDTGRPGSDGGMCADEGHSPSCAMATDLGTLEPGSPAIRRTGVIPVTGGEDWMKVGFPYHGTDERMEGGGRPHIHFSVNEGDAFAFEVRARCSAAMACGGTGAASRDLVEWDFTDMDDMGEATFMSRDVEWPVDIYIRVYRASGAGDCSGYELTIER